MAKNKDQQGQTPGSDNSNTEGTVNGNAPETTKRTPEEIEKEMEEVQNKLKALRAEKKGEKPKKDRVIKGKMIAFKNQKGDVITGLGSLYYVARSGGKLHYKAADAVVLLPEGWKEGDAIPELPGDEAPLT